MTINLSTLLDVAVSLVFVFFTLSIFVSGIVELLNSLIEKRSKLLKLALRKILEDGTFNAFWGHQLIKVKEHTTSKFFGRAPISYLSADSFSTVLIAVITQVPPTRPLTAPTPPEQTLEHLRQVIGNPQFGKLKDIVEPLLAKANSLLEFKAALERWYDGYMEQVSGWFKNHVRAVVLAVSAVVTLLFNIDTVLITKRIFTDKSLRANLVAQAQATAQYATQKGIMKRDTAGKVMMDVLGKPIISDSNFVKYLLGRRSQKDTILAQSLTSLDSLAQKNTMSGMDSLIVKDLYLQYMQDKIEALGLPIGWIFPPDADWGVKWNYFWRTFFSWSLVGWILTAAALSFGAPFWFDLLLKLVNIRNVSRKPKPVSNFIEGAD